MKSQAEQNFVGKYIDKKMKNHNLPYGMAYFALFEKTELKAEKLWKKKNENYTKLLNELLKGSDPKDKYNFQVYLLNKMDQVEKENEALKKKSKA